MDCPIDWQHHVSKYWDSPPQELSGDTLTASEAHDYLSAAGSAKHATPNQDQAALIMATEGEEDLQTPTRIGQRKYYGRRPLLENAAVQLSVKDPETFADPKESHPSESTRSPALCQGDPSLQPRPTSPSEIPRMWLRHSTLQEGKTLRQDKKITQGSRKVSNCLTIDGLASFPGKVHELERWSTTIMLYSNVTYRKDLGLRVDHEASLTISQAREARFDKPVSLSIVIRNGPQIGGTYKLKPGENTVQLRASKHAGTASGHTVEILVEREPQDAATRMTLQFTCLYPTTTSDMSLKLPVIYPRLGKVLWENIWLEKARPPLSICPVPCGDFLTTWQFKERCLGKKQVLCFERPELPSLVPEALRDDPIVRLCHLRLAPLAENLEISEAEVEKPSSIIKSLCMMVKVLPEGRLECRMSFDLRVGSNQQLLAIEAQGWQIKYASINGRPCTSKEVPRWWEENNSLSLYGSCQTAEGALLEVDVIFITTEGPLMESNLPRIMDKTIFGGVLTSSFNNASVHVKQAGRTEYEKLPSTGGFGGGSTWLPTWLPGMTPGYKLHLCFTVLKSSQPPVIRSGHALSKTEKIRFSGGIPLQPRSVRFADEHSTTSSDIDGKSAFACGTYQSEKVSYATESGSNLADDEWVDEEVSDDEGVDTEVSDLEGSGMFNTVDQDYSVAGADSLTKLRKGSIPNKTGMADLGRQAAIASNCRKGYSKLDSRKTNDVPHPGGLIDYLIDVVLYVVRHLERMSPMQCLIRFLILECACFAMYQTSLDGQPANGFSLNPSNTFTTTANVLSADFDASIQPLPDVRLDGISTTHDGGHDMDHVSMETHTDGAINGHRMLNLRDRIDLALGWRPLN
ncbi:MAG: hypothetical protein Q9218_004883 [Villophora microphyllina]